MLKNFVLIFGFDSIVLFLIHKKTFDGENVSNRLKLSFFVLYVSLKFGYNMTD